MRGNFIRRTILNVALLACCGAAAGAFGQNSSIQIDSLRRILRQSKGASERARTLCQLCQAWLNASQLDSAAAAGHQGLTLARRSGNPSEQTDCLIALAGVYFQKAQYQALYDTLSSALPLFSQQTSRMAELQCQHYLGSSQMMLGNYPSAIRHLQQALGIARALNDSVRMGRALGSLGNVYESMQDYERALDYQQRSLALFERLRNETGIGIATNNLGNALRGLKRYEEALAYYQRSIDIDRRKGTRFDVAIDLVNIGITLQRMGRLDEALTYLHESLAIREELKDPWGIAGSHLSLAEVYASKGNWHTVREHARQALQTAHSIRHLVILEKAAYQHFRADSALGDYQSAMHMHIQHKHYADSLYNNERSQEMGRIESEFRFNQQAELERQLNRNRTQWIIGTALGALLLLGALAYSLYRGRRKAQAANRSLQNLYLKLELHKAEIESQNSEIIAQRDQLESTNERLTQLDRMKEELAGMIVHDLKNPLNTILSLATLPPNEVRLGVIRGAGQQMSQLILNLLDVQKYESAALVLHREPTSVLKLLQTAVEQTRFLAQQKGIRFRIDCHPSLMVDIDRELMLRVWVNLLTNALKYAPTGDELLLEGLFVPTQTVLLRLTDHGMGIPPERLDQIFDKYSQVDGGLPSGQLRSSGLGLTFCRLTVEAHGGRIRAYSELNRFTTFEIELSQATHSPPELASISLLEFNSPALLPPDLLAQYATEVARLRQTPVYAMGEILDVLESLPDQPETLAAWKSAVEAYALTGYTEGYLQLLEGECPPPGGS